MLNPHINLQSKTVLITGASQGIGLATAKVLAGYGATVVLAARSIDKIHHAVANIRQAGGAAHGVVCDVTDYLSVSAAVDATLAHTGCIDVLVNNAGVIDPLTSLVDSDPALWSHAVDVNLKGVYFSMRAVLPHMIKLGSGTVVNMSSGAANSALEGWSHYCSTKAAAKKVTEVAHAEVGAQGIKVIGLSPGTVATDMMAKIRDAQINAVSRLAWSSHIPPEWVGEGVAYLCSPDSDDLAGSDFSLKTPEGRARVGLPA